MKFIDLNDDRVYKGIEEAYRKLGLRSQINTILKPALERSLQRGTHW